MPTERISDLILIHTPSRDQDHRYAEDRYLQKGVSYTNETRTFSLVRQQACHWYEDPLAHAHTIEYEKSYSYLPRLLFEELSLAQVSKNDPTILDGAPAEWLGRQSLTEKTDRLDIPAPLWRLDFRTFPQAARKYDLILVYSVLRLMPDPPAFLTWLKRNLTPEGRCCFVDFIGNIDEELTRHILGRIPSKVHQQFLLDQLAAAPKPEQIQQWLFNARIDHYRLAIGGLGGYEERSEKALTLIAQNTHLVPLLMQLSRSGYKSRRAADIVFHLTFAHGGDH